MKKEYTSNQLAFFEALLGEAQGDITKAIKIAGYSENTKLTDIVKNLREEIRGLSKDALNLHSVKAAFAIIKLLDDPNQAGANHILNAAKEVLNRAGVEEKTDTKVNVPQGGLLILPAKGAKVDLTVTQNNEVEIRNEKEATEGEDFPEVQGDGEEGNETVLTVGRIEEE